MQQVYGQAFLKGRVPFEGKCLNQECSLTNQSVQLGWWVREEERKELLCCGEDV